MIIGNGSPVISGYSPSSSLNTNPFRYQTAKNTTGFGSNNTVAQPYYVPKPVAQVAQPQPQSAAPAYQGPSSMATNIPDYASLIQNDPTYQALVNNLSAQNIQNAAQRASATQRALIQFGMVPDFAANAQALGLSPNALNYLGQDVTPDIAALAGQNTANGLSTEAQLQRANDNAVRGINNNLAARGALSSGETPYEQNNQKLAYAGAQQNALNALLDAISGYQNSYLTAYQNNQNQLISGAEAAAARQEALQQNQPATYSYNPSSGQYEGSGGTYTPYQGPAGTVVVNNQTGDIHELNSDGTIGLQVPTVNAGLVDQAGRAGRVVAFG